MVRTGRRGLWGKAVKGRSSRESWGAGPAGGYGGTPTLSGRGTGMQGRRASFSQQGSENPLSQTGPPSKTHLCTVSKASPEAGCIYVQGSFWSQQVDFLHKDGRATLCACDAAGICFPAVHTRRPRLPQARLGLFYMSLMTSSAFGTMEVTSSLAR